MKIKTDDEIEKELQQIRIENFKEVFNNNGEEYQNLYNLKNQKKKEEREQKENEILQRTNFYYKTLKDFENNTNNIEPTVYTVEYNPRYTEWKDGIFYDKFTHIKRKIKIEKFEQFNLNFEQIKTPNDLWVYNEKLKKNEKYTENKQKEFLKEEKKNKFFKFLDKEEKDLSDHKYKLSTFQDLLINSYLFKKIYRPLKLKFLKFLNLKKKKEKLAFKIYLYFLFRFFPYKYYKMKLYLQDRKEIEKPFVEIQKTQESYIKKQRFLKKYYFIIYFLKFFSWLPSLKNFNILKILNYYHDYKGKFKIKDIITKEWWFKPLVFDPNKFNKPWLLLKQKATDVDAVQYIKREKNDQDYVPSNEEIKEKVEFLNNADSKTKYYAQRIFEFELRHAERDYDEQATDLAKTVIYKRILFLSIFFGLFFYFLIKEYFMKQFGNFI